MKNKLKKLVYELSEDARVKTKLLGKKLKISQQAASYWLQSLQKKKVILSYNPVIDPAKFGLVQVHVYFNYTSFDSKKIKEIIAFLKAEDNVTLLEELEHGFDLAAVYCVTNLSLYNKLVRAFLQQFRGAVFLAKAYPVIVRHIYTRKYLAPRKLASEIIVSGDRDVADITENEKKVLALLWENAGMSVIDIHKKSKLNPKTIANLKKRLEESRVIRGYSTNFNLDSIGIQKKHLLLSSKSLSLADDKRLLDFAMAHPNIVEVTRFIGDYDLLIEFEEESNKRRDVLQDLRTEFPFQNFKIVSSKGILKQKYVPHYVLDEPIAIAKNS